tara:strand:- start:450 stop:668 length:219 start_codon:yes stop_codon:yes gene_type:complete
MLRSIQKLKALIPKNTTIMPLGRWCHPEYNDKCNVDIKSHLANLDNNYTTNWEEEKSKNYEHNLIKVDPNIK